jgi:FkbM family methyltransferase
MLDLLRPIHFRGKARLLNWIGPTSGTVTCKVFGVDFTLDLSDWIQRQIYFGTFEPGETGVVRSRLKPGMTFVDVGANVGYFTALAAGLVGPTGCVIAFEPSPYAFARLQRLTEVNRLSQVKLVQAGLSDRSGIAHLYEGVGSHNHTPTMVAHENATKTAVAVRTLDATPEEMGVEQIDLMKIDVEGYEPYVLADAADLLRQRRVRSILCEFNSHWLARNGSSPEDLEGRIVDAGLKEQTVRRLSRTLDNRFFCLGPVNNGPS